MFIKSLVCALFCNKDYISAAAAKDEKGQTVVLSRVTFNWRQRFTRKLGLHPETTAKKICTLLNQAQESQINAQSLENVSGARRDTFMKKLYQLSLERGTKSDKIADLILPEHKKERAYQRALNLRRPIENDETTTSNQWQKVVEELESAQGVRPDDLLVQIASAKKKLAHFQYKEALTCPEPAKRKELLEDALKNGLGIAEECARTHYELGKILFDEKENAKAKGHLEQCLEQYPDVAPILGKIALQEHRFQDAIDNFTDARLNEPQKKEVQQDLIEAQYQRAMELKNQDREAAKKLFQTVNEQADGDSLHKILSSYELGCLSLEEKKYDDAVDSLFFAESRASLIKDKELCKQIEPKLGEAYFQKGCLYLEQKDYENALEHLLEAKKRGHNVGTKLGEVYYQKGLIALNEKNWDRVQTYFELAANEKHAQAAYQLGLFYLGDLGRGFTDPRKDVAMVPEEYRNIEKAKLFLTEASNQGVALASSMLGALTLKYGAASEVLLFETFSKKGLQEGDYEQSVRNLIALAFAYDSQGTKESCEKAKQLYFFLAVQPRVFTSDVRGNLLYANAKAFFERFLTNNPERLDEVKSFFQLLKETNPEFFKKLILERRQHSDFKTPQSEIRDFQYILPLLLDAKEGTVEYEEVQALQKLDARLFQEDKIWREAVLGPTGEESVQQFLTTGLFF